MQFEAMEIAEWGGQLPVTWSHAWGRDVPGDEMEYLFFLNKPKMIAVGRNREDCELIARYRDVRRLVLHAEGYESDNYPVYKCTAEVRLQLRNGTDLVLYMRSLRERPRLRQQVERLGRTCGFKMTIPEQIQID